MINPNHNILTLLVLLANHSTYIRDQRGGIGIPPALTCHHHPRRMTHVLPSSNTQIESDRLEKLCTHNGVF